MRTFAAILESLIREISRLTDHLFDSRRMLLIGYFFSFFLDGLQLSQHLQHLKKAVIFSDGLRQTTSSRYSAIAEIIAANVALL